MGELLHDWWGELACPSGVLVRGGSCDLFLEVVVLDMFIFNHLG